MRATIKITPQMRVQLMHADTIQIEVGESGEPANGQVILDRSATGRAIVAVDALALRTVVTESLMGMITAITGRAPPEGPLPDFIQAPIDRAIERIGRLLEGGEPGAGDAVKALRELLAASDAVVDLWHTPLWKDSQPTAEYIAALRLAAESARKLLEGGE